MLTKKLLVQSISLLTVCLALSTTATAQEDPLFYFGVDLSYVNEMDDCGAVYQEDGSPRDAFELFADHGANLVRARLWHNPDWTEYSTLNDVKRTFTRARDAGLTTLLDIHYSDNWADPGTQEIPAAWEDLDDDALVDAVYQYTTDVLTELAAEGLVPAFVQVGNETNSGMLHRGGEQNWARDARLFNAGIQAARDFSAESDRDVKILLHVAQPQNTMWWFTEAEAAGITDFDVIGISFYPQWSTFSIGDMGAQVTTLRQRFGKEVMVLETAYGWTREAVDETADNVLDQGLRGYSFSVEGQYQFMRDLSQSLISNGALGVVYWEPAWVSTECTTRWGQGSHWENATFFDFQNDNELLESIHYLSDDYLYPDVLADGVIEASYGDPFVQDGPGDDLNNFPALDLDSLYVQTSEDVLSVAITTVGDVFSREGTYLLYIDTTWDDQGATEDVERRPILAAYPYKPEFRLDIGITVDGGTTRASYTLNAWNGTDWEDVTFTGSAAIVTGQPSVLELQLPFDAIGTPQSLNLALVSTDRGRARGASDILGVITLPDETADPLMLDAFFKVDLSN